MQIPAPVSRKRRLSSSCSETEPELPVPFDDADVESSEDEVDSGSQYQPGQWVVVKYMGKKVPSCFVGQVIDYKYYY